MILYKISLICLACLIEISQAAVFKVICSAPEYSGDSVSVVIDDITYPMTTNNKLFYTYRYEGTPTSYYYVVTKAGTPVYSEKDIFGLPRSWEMTSTSTLNEVFGRWLTVGDSILKPMPRLYPKKKNYEGFSVLFQEGEIPIVHVLMTSQDYNTLTTETGEGRYNKYTINFEIYTPYEIYTFTNGTLELSGMGSRNQVKKPYEIKFSEGTGNDDNNELFDRSAFKLRSLYFDSTYIKNKLAIDITESLGLPVAQTGHARLYVNNWPFGLYDFSETYKKKFIRNSFHYGIKKSNVVLGSYYKGVSGMEYPAYLYPDPANKNSELYHLQFAPEEYPDPYADLIEFQTWIASLTTTTPRSEIESRFDVDMYLKYMVVEYLTCHWDGYLINGNNYFLYREKKRKILLYVL